MKKIRLSFFYMFTIFLFLCTWRISCERKCDLLIDQEEIQVGKITDNTNVYLSFRLINSTSEDITINRIKTSASYVVVQQQPEKVLAGDTAEVNLMVLSADIAGPFSVRVDVEIPHVRQPHPVYVTGFVEKTLATIQEKCRYPFGKLFFSEKELAFGKVALNKIYRDTILVYNPTGEIQTLHAVTGSDIVRCRLTDRAIRPGKAAYLEISLKATDVKQLGKCYENILFTVGRELGTSGLLSVEADVTENFEALTAKEKKNAPRLKLNTTKFDFGSVKAGTEIPYSFVVKNDGKKDLIIRKVQASCGCTAIVPGLRVVTPGETTMVDVVFKSAGKQGKQQKSILLFCNDPLQSEVKLWITGIVE